jgi:hypothetical protein
MRHITVMRYIDIEGHSSYVILMQPNVSEQYIIYILRTAECAMRELTGADGKHLILNMEVTSGSVGTQQNFNPNMEVTCFTET